MSATDAGSGTAVSVAVIVMVPKFVPAIAVGSSVASPSPTSRFPLIVRMLLDTEIVGLPISAQSALVKLMLLVIANFEPV